MQFTEEEITEIKSLVNRKDLIDDEKKKEIRKLIASAIEQDYFLAFLYVKCFDYLLRIKDNLNDEDNDFSLKVDDFLKEYVQKCNIKELREVVQKLNRIDGGIGTYHLQKNLEKEVETMREDMINFTSFFIKIGVEE